MRSASVGQHPPASSEKRALEFDLRWLALVVLGLLLAWFVAPHSTVDGQVSPSARLQESRPQRVAVLHAPSAASTLHVNAANAANTVKAEVCETITVQGSHTTTTIEEARMGAAEDIRDVCPSSRVEQVRETCGADMADDADGVPQQVVRCQQIAACRLCGEHLARRRELIAAR